MTKVVLRHWSFMMILSRSRHDLYMTTFSRFFCSAMGKEIMASLLPRKTDALIVSAVHLVFFVSRIKTRIPVNNGDKTIIHSTTVKLRFNEMTKSMERGANHACHLKFDWRTAWFILAPLALFKIQKDPVVKVPVRCFLFAVIFNIHCIRSMDNTVLKRKQETKPKN